VSLYFPGKYRSDILSVIPMSTNINLPESGPPPMMRCALSRDSRVYASRVFVILDSEDVPPVEQKSK